MGEKTENTKTANLVETVKEEVEAVKADAAKAVKKAASKTKEAASKTKEVVQEKQKRAVRKKEELKPEVIVQYAGNDASVEEILEKVKKLYVDGGHYQSSIKSLQVYVKPEENAAYYVINNKQSGKIDLF